MSDEATQDVRTIANMPIGELRELTVELALRWHEDARSASREPSPGAGERMATSFALFTGTLAVLAQREGLLGVRDAG